MGVVGNNTQETIPRCDRGSGKSLNHRRFEKQEERDGSQNGEERRPGGQGGVPSVAKIKEIPHYYYY